MNTTATPTRAQLVHQWRDLWSRIEVAQGEERAAMLRELQRLESQAMHLIVHEHESEVRP